MDRYRNEIYICVLGLIPTIWLALLIAPYINQGLFGIIKIFPSLIDNPLRIIWCNDSFKVICILSFIYLMGIGVYIATKRNYRKGEEHGSARWGNISTIKKKYHQAPSCNNKLLTNNVSIGLDGKIHRRNLNTLVIGGSGAGKTRFYAIPNILQANTSYVILDPKGEIIRATGGFLKNEGYEVKVLDLINMERSHCYNPIVYVTNDNDVQRLVTNIFKSTTPKVGAASDPFWDTAASMLLSALIFYLKHEAPEEEQNFSMVMEMIRYGDVKEDDDMYSSPLDLLFERLEEREPNHIAVKYYKNYRSGSAKTLKSIQITLVSKLEKFNLDSVASLTATDELELDSFGDKKVALFAIIPDNDSSFNFLVSILYTQLFQRLFFLADYKYGGSLPIPVHFLMDEFNNVSLPNDFEKILSVIRSRQIFVSIILQNLAQIKALFEKQWESIVGNCDEFLYLGGNEQSVHKYASELLGKATIDMNTYGKSSGRSGNYSTNYQISGRELMTPDELARLDNKYALLFIRGERPIKDLKYDVLRHINVKKSLIGGAKPYIHGECDKAVASINIDYDAEEKESTLNIEVEDDYEVISSENIEEYLIRRERNEK